MPLGSEWDRFGGVTLGHVPDGLAGGLAVALPISGLNDYRGPTESGGAPDRWTYLYTYRFSDEPYGSLVVEVTCGSEFPLDDEQLAMHLEPKTLASAAPAPYPMSSGQPAYLVDGHFGEAGKRVGWLQRPGVVVEVSVTEELAGQLDQIVDSVELRHAGETAAACPPPDVQPTALPWLAEGEPLPAPLPIRDGDEPGAGLVWASDPGAEWHDVPYVSITRLHRPDTEPGEHVAAQREVRGHPAEAVWVGDPGNSAINVRWREADGDCGVYRLSVNSRDVAPMLGEQWAEGGRCEPGVADQQCFEEFHDAFNAELDRILDSLEGTG